MRPLTDFEKEQINNTFSETSLPLQAVTIEYEYFERHDTTEKIYFWEEMLFPSRYLAGNLLVDKIYVDNPVLFSSPDSPSPEVTGQQKNFFEIADDTIYFFPEADEIIGNSFPPPTDRMAFTNLPNAPTEVDPGLIWARRIKVYTFNVDGSIADISYYVFQEVSVDSGTPDVTLGLGSVLVAEADADTYTFAVSDMTNNGNVYIHLPLSDDEETVQVEAESVLPASNEGDVVHLLGNAQEAREYIKRVTLTGGLYTYDAYADRQKAREDLATALWG